MRKSFKHFMIYCLVLFLVAGFMIFIFKLDDDYARITAVDYEATVVDDIGSNGKVHIKERLTFDVHAASKDNTFWELWRELPEAYYDGVKVDYNVISVKEVQADGTLLSLPESDKLYWYDEDFTDDSGVYGPGKWFHSEGPYDDYYNYESLIFYVDGIYRDTVTYEIEYEMFNASLRYHDASELYLAMYSGSTTKYLKSFSAKINIPSDKMPREENYKAYTYGTDAHAFDFTTSDNLVPGYVTFSFNLDEEALKFHDYNEYIEFAMITFGDDKHIFTENASLNDYYLSDVLDDIMHEQEVYESLPSVYHEKKVILLKTLSFISVGLVVLVILIERLYRRSVALFKPEQKIEYFRDIPSDADPSFIRQLVFNDQKDIMGQEGFASALLSLIQKKAIELETKDQTKKDIPSNILIKINQNDVALSSIEKHYFDLIERHTKNEAITLKDLQDRIEKDYSYTDSFVKRVETALKQYGVTNKYYQKLNYKTPKNTMKGFGIAILIIGIVITIIGNLSLYGTRMDLGYGAFFVLGAGFLISSVYLMVLSRQYILFTQFGADEREKWRALYRFLNNETLMVERGVKDLVLWEKYLIYATAFGISHKVIKAFKMVFPKEVIETSRLYYNTRMTRNNTFRNYTRSLSSSTRSASFVSRSGGHSGGYGGGGRGGGGGGGGH